MAVKLNLPAFNGEIGAGLAASAEKEIEESQKLRILVSSAVPGQKAIEHTLAFLYQKLKADNEESEVIDFAIASAYVILKAQMVSKTSTGHIVCDLSNMEVVGFDQESTDAVAKAVDPSKLSDAATMIVATKINWYKENHHCGQGSYASITHGYTKKCAVKIWGEQKAGKLWKMIYIVGHWACTLRVLGILKVEHVLAAEPLLELVPADKISIKVAEDVTIRMKSNPAGTARTAIAHAVWSMLVTSPVAIFCPGIEDATEVVTQFKRIKGLKSHIGAKFATGIERDFNDNDSERFLGRAYIFLDAFISTHTLMKSPHLVKGDNYPDYSIEFKTLIASFKKEMSKATKDLKMGTDVKGLSSILTAAAGAFGKTPAKMAMSAIENAEKKAKEDKEAAAGKKEETAK